MANPPAKDNTAPSEGRRREILEAAAEVFAEKGFQRATMKEVASAAGVAPGTIYLYFQHKRDLLMAIADQLIGQSVKQSLDQPADTDVREFLSNVVRDRFRIARENRHLINALITEVWTDEELQCRCFTEIILPLFSIGSIFIQHQVSRGALRPCRPEVILPAIAGSIAMLATARARFPDSPLGCLAEEEVIQELENLYFYGLGVSPNPPAGEPSGREEEVSGE